MHRHHVAPEAIEQDTLILRGAEAHHLLHVLRLREGAEVGAFDGAGRTRLYHIIAHDADSLTLAAKQPIFRTADPPMRLRLFVCVPKGERMDWLLEKATELGVSEIVPVISARTVVRLEGRQAIAKRDRWQRIVEAAARQCGAALVPHVRTPQPFAEALPLTRECTIPIVAALTPEARPLMPLLVTLDPERPGQTWGWWCGPEGDFTPAELQALLDAGARPVTLGPLILRVETAALYGLACLGCARNNRRP